MSYIVRDNLGSTRSLVESSGSVVSTFSYDSYGNVTVPLGSITDTRFLYTCQEYDLQTGLSYYNARWYSPTLGRFISKDPLSFAAGDANLYRYVGNNSTTYTDPSGLCEESNGGAASDLLFRIGETPVTADNGSFDLESDTVAISTLGDDAQSDDQEYFDRKENKKNWFFEPSSSKPRKKLLPDKVMPSTPLPPPEPGGGINRKGPSAGFHGKYRIPGKNDLPVGSGAGGPCIIVVIICKDAIYVFHLTATDNPGRTIGAYRDAIRGGTAIIAGGTDDPPSKGTLEEANVALGDADVTIEGYIPSTGAFYKDGEWYHEPDPKTQQPPAASSVPPTPPPPEKKPQ